MVKKIRRTTKKDVADMVKLIEDTKEIEEAYTNRNKIEKLNSALENIDISKLDVNDLVLTLRWEIMKLNKKMDEIIDYLNQQPTRRGKGR